MNLLPPALLFMLPLSLCFAAALNTGIVDAQSTRSTSVIIAISYSLITFRFFFRKRGLITLTGQPVGGFLALFLISLGALIFLYVSTLTAPSSWDALHYWFKHASTYFDFMVSVDRHNMALPLSDKHPLALPALIAMLSLATSLTPAIVAAALWVMCFAVIALVCSAYVYQETKSKQLCCLVAGLLLTSPLLVNHTILFGYSEIWMACALTSGTLAASRAKNLQGILLAILVVGCAGLVKNIGFFLPLILVSSMILTRYGGQVWLGALLSIIFIVFVLNWLLGGLVVGPNGFISFGLGEKLIIEFGPKPLWIRTFDNFLVIEAWIGALVLNSSFSTLPLALIVVSAAFFMNKTHNNPALADYKIIGLVILKFIFLCFLMTAFTHYGFTRSEFGKDTLLSRELLVVFPLSLIWIVLVGYWYVEAKNCIQSSRFE